MSYRRRSLEEGVEFEVRTKKSNASGIHKMAIDNSWVVPYSPDLLQKFRTHKNSELCISRVRKSNICSSTFARVPIEQQLR